MSEWSIQSVITDYGSEINFNDLSQEEIGELINEDKFLESIAKRTWARLEGGIRLPAKGTIPNDHRFEAAFRRHLEAKKAEAVATKIAEKVYATEV